MARISIMEALSRILTASKNYTDEQSIILDNDGEDFAGFDVDEYPDLRTESKTVIGAINELNDKKETVSKQELIDSLENVLEIIIEGGY